MTLLKQDMHDTCITLQAYGATFSTYSTFKADRGAMYLHRLKMLPLGMQLMLQSGDMLDEVKVVAQMPVTMSTQAGVLRLQTPDSTHLTVVGSRPVCLAAQAIEAKHAVDCILCCLQYVCLVS